MSEQSIKIYHPKHPCTKCGAIGIEKFRLSILGKKAVGHCLECEIKKIKYRAEKYFIKVPINRKPCTVCGGTHGKKFRYHFSKLHSAHVRIYPECSDCYCRIKIEKLYKIPFGCGDDKIFNKFSNSLQFRNAVRKLSVSNRKERGIIKYKLVKKYINMLEKNVEKTH